MKKEIDAHIEKILRNLPKSPGVYQMKDKGGKVIYVGKAKSLRNRVNSYFDRTSELTLAKRQMVGKIADIETILCSTEVEALVLETNLIKHLTPKYNILMKDDKNLAYLKITNSPVPELVKTRIKVKDGGEYYGPYVAGVEQSVRALRRIFRIRNCRMKFSQISPPEKRELEGVTQIGKQNNVTHPNPPLSVRGIKVTDKAGKTIPCMDYYIGLCPAPCLLEEAKIREHDTHIDRVRAFLSGRSSDAIMLLETEMREKAKNLEFEKAKELKETIDAMRGLHERQKVRDTIEGDVDIFLMYEKYDKSYIALTQIRSSQIIGVFRHEVIIGADDRENITVDFLMRQYVDLEDIPDILILSDEIGDEAFLSFAKSAKISLEYPQIGPKKDIIDFTRNQLREYAYKREMATLENRTLTRDHMVNILERLGYEVPKKGEIVFECYDISHTDGHFTYASRVSVVNGKPETNRYKKYKIKTLEDGDIDDYASHREVMMRRTMEGLEYENFPHLIIIDGGKGQLSSALSGVKEAIWQFRHSDEGRIQVSGILDPSQAQDDGSREFPDSLGGNIPLCSIAKREEEVFLPGKKEPILFEHGTPELMVLQKARDESHRFSIGANKQARMKSMKKNILEEIPGIGPVTRKKLLKLAGSVDEIKNIKLEVIEKIVTKSQLETLKDHGLL